MGKVSDILRYRPFKQYLAYRLLITLAFQMQSVVVGWQIYEITQDALWLGMIGLAEVIPFIAVSLFAGHFADIINRKKILYASVAALTLCQFLLLILSFFSSFLVASWGAPVYFIIVIVGLARAFLAPAQFGYLSQLIPREQYIHATSWNSNLWHFTSIAGPALGGLIFGFWGVRWAYGFSLAVALASCLILWQMPYLPDPESEAKRENVFDSIGKGLRFVFGTPMMLGALALDLFAVLFGGAVALLPIFAAEVLNVGAQGLGLLRAAPAAGALLMAVWLTRQPPLERSGHKLLWSVAGFGVCMIAFAFSKNFYISFFLLLLSGAFDNVSVVIRQAIMQLITPDHMRGRVSSVNSIFISSSNELGQFESGVAAKLLGLIPSVIFGGIMTLLSVAGIGVFNPKLRNLELKNHQQQSSSASK